MLDNMQSSGGSLMEPTIASEDVQVIKRKGDVPKPDDMQCVAIGGNTTRCMDDKFYDEAGRLWSVFCRIHTDQNEQGRITGAARPIRI